MKKLRCILVAMVLTGLAATPARAKKDGPDNGDPNQPPKVKLPPEQRFLQSIRDRMEVTDDAEWDALQGRIARVIAVGRMARDVHDARRSMESKGLRAESRGAFMGVTVTYSAQVEATLGALAEKAAALGATMNDPNARPAEIEFRLADYRKTRAEAERAMTTELTRVRQELRELVTPRQELMLVGMGLLD